jgi:SAM-dependent methyltransferase
VNPSRDLLQASLDLVDELDAVRIVELGIAQGGSVALLASYARPERMVALELDATPHAVLEEFLRARGLQERVRTHYGVDQADADAVLDAVGDGPLDLVLDDASHRLHETRASFNTLFPLLRPGGVYAVEDWAWGHQDRAVELARRSGSSGWWPGGPPLTILAVEAVLATDHPDVVARVEVDDHLVRVVRGTAHLDPRTFDLRDHVSRAGSRLLDSTYDPLFDTQP